MKKRIIVMLAALLVASLPLAVVAMEHKEMDHGNHSGMEHETMEHGSMAMPGDMIMVGNHEVDGVEAMVHLKDVKEAMGKMGMAQTHHFMVMFVDKATGDPVEQGMAAVKILDPTGKEGNPVALMGMQGHFGADISLSTPGEYVFKLGTKLADGKNRQFEFKFSQK
ncbi:MAG: hypothetical protein A2X84_09400 [Desulfuromonadaceae bacterium GWC2_58_13]|nr:MAG: hypothetical protein A2X84_09400 [Desulfuromonadaceae bacterium GWC2_58_13]